MRLPSVPAAVHYKQPGRGSLCCFQSSFPVFRFLDLLVTVVASTRPLSPAPYSAQFASAADFHREQARWFCDHGDGSELMGTRREQNTAFDRLRDKLFGARRDRANPSGTRRTV